jgi:hypothetical protein
LGALSKSGNSPGDYEATVVVEEEEELSFVSSSLKTKSKSETCTASVEVFSMSTLGNSKKNQGWKNNDNCLQLLFFF